MNARDYKEYKEVRESSRKKGSMKYIAFCVGTDGHEFPLAVRQNTPSLVKRFIKENIPYAQTILSITDAREVTLKRMPKPLIGGSNIRYK